MPTPMTDETYSNNLKAVKDAPEGKAVETMKLAALEEHGQMGEHPEIVEC